MERLLKLRVAEESAYNIGKSLKERLYERDGNRCHYCHIEENDFIPIWGIFYENPNRGPTLEIERKNNNQDYTMDNFVLACPLCNNAKTDKLTECEMIEVGKVIEKIWKRKKYGSMTSIGV
ncbi:MAG: hypothetical protein ABSG75_16705 [Syntrophales bacterium]|jgi:5-methylcytosine-specific restriction endonuclease McrA